MEKSTYFLSPNMSHEERAMKLQSLGFSTISSEAATQRRANLRSVIFKDILRYKLVELNSFYCGGQEYKFTYLNINQAIVDIDVPLASRLEATGQTIKEMLEQGRFFEEKWVDERKGIFHLRYIDQETWSSNDLNFVENFLVQKENSEKVIIIELVLFINGIPFAFFNKRQEELAEVPQFLKYMDKDFQKVIFFNIASYLSIDSSSLAYLFIENGY